MRVSTHDQPKHCTTVSCCSGSSSSSSERLSMLFPFLCTLLPGPVNGKYNQDFLLFSYSSTITTSSWETKATHTPITSLIHSSCPLDITPSVYTFILPSYISRERNSPYFPSFFTHAVWFSYFSTQYPVWLRPKFQPVNAPLCDHNMLAYVWLQSLSWVQLDAS